MMKVVEVVKLIYLYLFSAIGLILIVTGASGLINLGLKAYVFKQADTYYTPKIYPPDPNMSPEEIKEREEEFRKAEEINRSAERQRSAANSIALIVVGLPLFIYHWRLAFRTSFR